MNFQTTHGGLRSSFGWGWCAAVVLASVASVQAQQRYYPQPQGGYPQQQPQYAPPPGYQQQPQGYGYPQQQPRTHYESPIEFLPKFGQKMSEMMRRLFYGQRANNYDSPAPGYGQGGSYDLDSSPQQQGAPNYPQQYPMPGQGYAPQQPQGYTQPQPGYQQQPGYQYPQQQQQQAQPRYNYPPQQSSQQQPAVQPPSRSTTPAPAPQSKSSTTTKKYSPPKVNDSPPARTTTSKPPTVTPKKEPKPASSPPPTTRRSESAPKEFPSTTASSGASGSFLKGKKTAKPGRVISPYPPYKELDITGLESGSLALDPTTQKVFEVP